MKEKKAKKLASRVLLFLIIIIIFLLFCSRDRACAACVCVCVQVCYTLTDVTFASMNAAVVSGGSY